MQRKELAKALGVSPSMVTRYAKRGMPTDTVERAQRWRRRHLEQSRVKENRFDPNTPVVQPPPQVQTPQPPASDRDQELAHLRHCLLTCIGSLATTVAWIDPDNPGYRQTLTTLRQALRTMPDNLMPQMALAAWIALVDHVLADESTARFSTDGTESLDQDDFATLAGGMLSGHHWLDVARDWDDASEIPPDDLAEDLEALE